MVDVVVGRIGRPHGLDGSFYVVEPAPELPAGGGFVIVEGVSRRIVRRSGNCRSRREHRRVVSVLEDALEHLVRGIVDNEDEVSVELTTGRRGRTLQIRVHPDDLGKVIGRAGRTATALRTVMSAVGGRGIRVDVVDTDR